MRYLLLVLMLSGLFPISYSVQGNTLQIGTFDFPPYEFKKDDVITGISVDIVKAVFNEMGINCEFIELPWSRALKYIKNGKIDGLFEVLWEAEREIFMDYAKEVLMPETASFFVLASSPIEYSGDMTPLYPYKVGVRQDFSYGPTFDYAIKNRKFQIIEKRTEAIKLLRMLNSAQIDLLIGDKYGTFYIHQHSIIRQKRPIRRLQPDVEDTPSYMVFTKYRNLKKISNQFSKVLRQHKADGRYQSIIDQWESKLKQDKDDPAL